MTHNSGKHDPTKIMKRYSPYDQINNGYRCSIIGVVDNSHHTLLEISYGSVDQQVAEKIKNTREEVQTTEIRPEQPQYNTICDLVLGLRTREVYLKDGKHFYPIESRSVNRIIEAARNREEGMFRSISVTNTARQFCLDGDYHTGAHIVLRKKL